jgi:tetraacyldisaccharide 4'-kinase
VEELRRLPVAAFCGIGNPLGFRRTLESQGANLLALREFPDHHPYTATDLDSLAHWSNSLAGVQAVVCTEKDLAKIDRDNLGSLPLWAVAVETEITSGADKLAELLDRLWR